MRTIVLLLLTIVCVLSQKPKPTRHVEVTADEEKIRDKLGYEAIAEIHREMDDDHSGSIDRKETSGFMKEDMQMRGSERLKREDKFHGSDEGVTVDEMWESWFESKERLWTPEVLADWLTNTVNLPMYAEAIQKNKFDGKILPRIAVHNTSFLTNNMGIKSSVHRQKLRLSALDVVLFGYRDQNSKTKDVLLAFVFSLFASVLILYVRQKQKAQKQVKDLSARLTELKSMENEFESIQNKLDHERSKRSTSDGGVNKLEMERLRSQLDEATRRLEENSSCETPLILQPLLRKTCENEMEMVEKQKQECIKEMKEAIELVDKLQKKQGSVLSSLKLATGAASASDQVDSRIFALKNRMEKIHAQSQEIQERWLQIESLCGFSILYLGETLPHSISHRYYGSSESSMSSSASAAHTKRKASIADLKQSSLVSNGSSALSEEHPEDLEDEKLTNSTTTVVFTAAPLTAADSISLASTAPISTTTKDVKKKKLAFSKLFKKTPSKNSLFSNGSK